MPASSLSARKAVLKEISEREARTPLGAAENGSSQRTSEYFGINTFGARQMRDKLPKDVYTKLVAAIRLGKKLDARHRAHGRAGHQGMGDRRAASRTSRTGSSRRPDSPPRSTTPSSPSTTSTVRSKQFTGAQLIQSEPDASSFPSGGLRATWEARGYTAWNPASPVFIVESADAKTLCIPSVFIGYHGEALDEMTPLLRSSDVLSQKAHRAARAPRRQGRASASYTTLGPEQEYFLIDRAHFALRPDLVMAGRTLIGAPPPRGQQLEDHYFGGIPERIQACIAEVEYELYKLGVPIVTRHNEVAPCQFEMAPIFEETDIAVDHNQLVMAMLRRVALRHGLQALLHEKPFAGINGSGKHCNWSMAITSDNPSSTARTCSSRARRRTRTCASCCSSPPCCKAVHKHAGLLRAGIATSGNEHRLGANEAPPAIISVFMGDDAHEGHRRDRRRQRAPTSAEQAMIKLGVAKLPEIEKDNTDRNRTSPFAFTGNKFEFRAVGSSQSIAFPIMLLNAAVAEAIGEITDSAPGGAQEDQDGRTTRCSRSCARSSRRRARFASRATTTPTNG